MIALPEGPTRVAPRPSVAALLARREFFRRHPAGHPEAGAYETRERTCLCGRAYVQHQVSEAWLACAEREGPGAVAALVRDLPGGWVPVHCPACESRALGRGAA